MFEAQAALSSYSVNDLGEAKVFYTKTLGLQIDNEDMDLQLLLPGGGKLFLYQKDDHQPATFTVLNFVVAHIDEALDALVAHGVVFEHYDNMPAAQDEKGVLRGIAAGQGPDIAWFKDPAGNILSLIQEK